MSHDSEALALTARISEPCLITLAAETDAVLDCSAMALDATMGRRRPGAHAHLRPIPQNFRN
jgi:hypothetical protein